MRIEQHHTALLDWSPTATGGWELTGERGLAARLLPDERAWLAEAGRQAWTVQRVGFHRPRVVIRPVGELAEVAHLQADWRGIFGLHFASGPTWEVDPTHSGGTVVRDEAQRVVARIAWHGGLGATGARVYADPEMLAGRFGTVCLATTGYLFLAGAARMPRIAIGVPFGATARTRGQE